MSPEGEVFKALADATRRDILRLLGGARRPVGELAASFPDISRPAVSKHLRILRQAGLVTEERDGRRRLYRLRPEALGAIGRWLAEVDPRQAGAVAGAKASRSGARLRRRSPGLRPLDRDEAEEPDWRAW